jgi:hypothetical protein
MDYSTLQTIAIICYMVSAGFLAVSVLIFFLMDMRQIIGRLTGSAQRKALAHMRSSGTVGKSGEVVVDMSLLEKQKTAGMQTSGRVSRRSGRMGKSGSVKTVQPPVPPVKAEPVQPHGNAVDYFGAPYPNKTPPAPVSPPSEPQTALMPEAPPETTIIQEPPQPSVPSAGSETMDLAGWATRRAEVAPPDLPAADDSVAPVKMTIVEDILFLHTETFIEIQ